MPVTLLWRRPTPLRILPAVTPPAIRLLLVVVLTGVLRLPGQVARRARCPAVGPVVFLPGLPVLLRAPVVFRLRRSRFRRTMPFFQARPMRLLSRTRRWPPSHGCPAFHLLPPSSVVSLVVRPLLLAPSLAPPSLLLSVLPAFLKPMLPSLSLSWSHWRRVPSLLLYVLPCRRSVLVRTLPGPCQPSLILSLWLLHLLSSGHLLPLAMSMYRGILESCPLVSSSSRRGRHHRVAKLLPSGVFRFPFRS